MAAAIPWPGWPRRPETRRHEDLKYIKPSSIARADAGRRCSAPRTAICCRPPPRRTASRSTAVCAAGARSRSTRRSARRPRRAGAEGVRDRGQALSPRPQAGCAHRVSMSAVMTASPPRRPIRRRLHGGIGADRRDDGRSGGDRPRYRPHELARARRAGPPGLRALRRSTQVLQARARALGVSSADRDRRRPRRRWPRHLPMRLPVVPVPISASGAGGDAAIVARDRNGDSGRA